MNVKKLIEELSKLPDNTEIVLLDHRMNCHNASGDGTPEGIYSEFDISEMDLMDLEEKPKSVVAFEFSNVWDYDEDCSRL